MKGFMIELRPVNNPRVAVSSGSLFANATEERRQQMARRLYGNSKRGKYIVIEYNADWTDCVNPVIEEFNRYEIGEDPDPEEVTESPKIDDDMPKEVDSSQSPE
jgi:ribosome recycling factor